jgi:hypothetical protein
MDTLAPWREGCAPAHPDSGYGLFLEPFFLVLAVPFDPDSEEFLRLARRFINDEKGFRRVLRSKVVLEPLLESMVGF